MRAVVQRVASARVTVAGRVVGELPGDGPGLLALVGVTHPDTAGGARALAAKLWTLRLLADPADPAGGSQRSCSDVGAGLLVVSQLTLYGDTRKGRRPSWNAAAPASQAQPLVEEVVAELRRLGAPVATGEFGAQMRVELVAEGPVTVIVDL